MSYVLTAIARESKFPEGTTDGVMALIKELPLKVANIMPLSRDKAIDFNVDLDLTKAGQESPSEAFVDELAAEIPGLLKQKTLEGVDLVFQKARSGRKPKLAVFDMDSTLIQQEVIELIAAEANVEEQVAEITRSAMNGEIDFKQSLAKRVALLRGIESEDLWTEMKTRIKLTPGAKELATFLKSTGCKLAVFSGGFLPLANYIKEELGLDYAFANVLGEEVDSNGTKVLAGTTVGEVVDGSMKRELLVKIAGENGIDLADSVATGDGANDLLMMGRAGFGVAWHAKPKVQQEAPSCLNSNSLADELYIFGYNQTEIDKVLSK